MASAGPAVARGRSPRGPAGGAAGRAGAGAWWSSDRSVERLLGTVASLVLVLILGMVIFVFAKAWPSFANNGLGWFGTGDVDRQFEDIINPPQGAEGFLYDISAFNLLWATALSTGAAVIIGMAFSLFAAIFIVEFAPPRVNRVLEPVVRLLAAVPSVVYGLIGILVLVPFVLEHLVTEERKSSVAFVVQLEGTGVLVAVAILTVMITPIMIAIIVDALRSVPRSWSEGASALGVNRWRVIWSIGVRTARPAIAAAAVLATARALGEAIMLAMVAGSKGFAPQPVDGLTFFLEPMQPLAATIIKYQEVSNLEPVANTLYAFAAVLLFSGMALSLAGYVAKQPMRKFGVR